MNELKRRVEVIQKDGKDVKIDLFYIELNINGAIVKYDLKLDFTTTNFLKQFIEVTESED